MKRYLLSALITFLAGFLVVLSVAFQDLRVESLTDGTLLVILLAAFRAGLKGLLEAFVLDLSK